jgi:hypothetical protein
VFYFYPFILPLLFWSAQLIGRTKIADANIGKESDVKKGKRNLKRWVA